MSVSDVLSVLSILGVLLGLGTVIWVASIILGEGDKKDERTEE